MSTITRDRPVCVQLSWMTLSLAGAGLFLLSCPLPAKATPQAQPATKAEAADRVTLPDGATIELAGVSEYPDRPESWWRADGTPLAKPPIGKLVCPQTPLADRSLRLFAFNVVTDGQAEIDEPSGPKGVCATQSTCTRASKTESGRSLLQEQIVAAIRPAARIDLVVNYDGGLWRTVATTDGHEGNLADRSRRPQVIWESSSTARFAPEIWVAHNIDLGPESVRLIAVDEDKVRHQPRYDSNSVSGHVQVRTVGFPDVRIDRVKEYRLETSLVDPRFDFKLKANPPGAAATHDVVWGPSGEDSDAATISAACRAPMKNGRIVAIDDKKREHISKFGEYVSVGNFCLMTAVFPRLAVARVKEFRFQTRTFHHHIEFRNVSLHAGQKNPAQIWLDGKRYIPKAAARDGNQ